MYAGHRAPCTEPKALVYKNAVIDKLNGENVQS